MPPDTFSYTEYLIYFGIAGFASGFVSGFFGIGGGFIRVPIFLVLFPFFMVHGELVMHTAAATSLALGIPSGIMSLRRRLKAGSFDWSYFRHWAVGLAVGSLIGVAFFPYVPSLVMKSIFLGLLVIFALYFGLVPDKLVLAKQPPRGIPRVLLSAGISSYTVMSGVGGGSSCSFAMKVSSMPLQAALGMATASALLINIIGATGCMITGWGAPNLPPWSAGYVDGIVFAAMLPGVLLASGWGAKASLGMDKQRLKRIYGVFLILIAGFMAYQLYL